MTEQEVFIIAQKSLMAVVNQIGDDQWSRIADELAPGKHATLRELINYHSYDDAWVTDTLSGKTIEEVGDAYEGDLLGDDPKNNFARYNEQAQEAVLTFSDLDKIVHLSYGDFPAREYLKHITCYRGFRTYTIARFLGVDTTMPQELVDGLWDEVIPEVEDWRNMGVFGPAIVVPEDSSKQTKLLGLTGFYRP